ncbi:hypothetical protein MKK55_12970 [Methylobacterium sp. J-059]|nr:hypothetical protein [Methylobacterium sp. J-059]MCJ2039844.1 hypothetical protein [Methylobacterium sp. J-059]
MTIEVAIAAAVLAIVGWAYLHVAGRKFDKKYPLPSEKPAPQENQAASR